MRPLRVVEKSPAVEALLHLIEIAEGPCGKDLCFKCAVEALVLAAALRMVGTGMDDLDAELEQEDAERRPLAGHAAAPGRSVVDIEGIRQAVEAEGAFQQRPYRLRPLVAAGRKAEREARVIVEHGERMAPSAFTDLHAALEVHLPQKIGGWLLEALRGRCPRGCFDQAMAREDRMHRRDGGRSEAFLRQKMCDLARAPAGMRLA